MTPEPEALAQQPLSVRLPRRSWCWPVCAALVLLLAACGPGVGGTGTGSELDPLATFGASPASLCEGAQTSVAACASVQWIDDAKAPRVSVSILVDSQGSRVELVDRCARLRFEGEWGVVGNGPARFYGSITVDGRNRLGSLTIAFSSDGMRIELRDIDGLLLLGPWLLLPAPIPLPTDAPSCGP